MLRLGKNCFKDTDYYFLVQTSQELQLSSFCSKLLKVSTLHSRTTIPVYSSAGGAVIKTGLACLCENCLASIQYLGQWVCGFLEVMVIGPGWTTAVGGYGYMTVD